MMTWVTITPRSLSNHPQKVIDHARVGVSQAGAGWELAASAPPDATSLSQELVIRLALVLGIPERTLDR